MIYQILNYFTERKITKLRPVAKRFLSADTHESSMAASKERLDMDRKYIVLVDRFKYDAKRRYMVNSNYLEYLKAVIYLYRTSSASVQSGILTAPTETYAVINAVQSSFDETLKAVQKI